MERGPRGALELAVVGGIRGSGLPAGQRRPSPHPRRLRRAGVRITSGIARGGHCDADPVSHLPEARAHVLDVASHVVLSSRARLRPTSLEPAIDFPNAAPETTSTSGSR